MPPRDCSSWPEGVEYLRVGGHAVVLHGRPRFTKDADLWVRDAEHERPVTRRDRTRRDR